MYYKATIRSKKQFSSVSEFTFSILKCLNRILERVQVYAVNLVT